MLLLGDFFGDADAGNQLHLFIIGEQADRGGTRFHHFAQVAQKTRQQVVDVARFTDAGGDVIEDRQVAQWVPAAAIATVRPMVRVAADDDRSFPTSRPGSVDEPAQTDASRTPRDRFLKDHRVVSNPWEKS